MIFKSPTIIKFLKKNFGFTDTQIRILQLQYMEQMAKIYLNSVYKFLEKTNDIEKLAMLKNLTDHMDEGDFYENMQNIMDKITIEIQTHPEIQSAFDKELADYDDILQEDLVANLSQEQYQELMTAGIEELKFIEKNEIEDNKIIQKATAAQNFN
ncbi:MAG: hypothetical protein WCJ58_02185 [bacterium]